MKILHIVGGSPNSGAYKGTETLHNALVKLNVDSKILNNYSSNIKNKKIIFLKINFFRKILNSFFIIIEKIIKAFLLHTPRSTFSFCFFGNDITKLDVYKNADIIHIHWLGEGFISLKSISKIKKPVIWTMRDMWPFTGGSHYTIDFRNYEKGLLSKIIKNYKKKVYKNKIQFVAISNWLKSKAIESDVLKDQEILKIYNNISLGDFKVIEKNFALSKLSIKTKKKIILYGAINPQSTRKGWEIFVDAIKKIDKSKYLLVIFGNFWSEDVLKSTGIEYKLLGFVKDKINLNFVYSCADLFVFTSIQEAFGKTWAESMACNTPVVCFKNTACAEIIDHKINGYVVESLSPENLIEGIDWTANKINKEKNDNKIREKIIDLDSQVIAKKYINLYLKIFKEKTM